MDLPRRRDRIRPWLSEAGGWWPRGSFGPRAEPDFVPAALALGSGIHGAAAFLFRGIAGGARPDVADVQMYFASLWALETTHRPVRFGEKDSSESLLDLGTRTLAVLCAQVADATQIVAVESAFAVPLVDQATGAVLDRDLVGTLDLVERDTDGRLVVVDLKTAARKYSDLQVEASLETGKLQAECAGL